MEIIYKEKVESTNVFASNLLDSGKIEEATLIYTDEQVAGKGYGTNSWESKAGENLVFSLVLFPNYIEASEQFLLSMAISLGICDFLNDFGLQNVKIKWPNDIYVGEKKICGILIENSVSGIHLATSIIGIGLNINQNVFKSNAPNPISLSQLTGKKHNLEESLKILVHKIAHELNFLKNKKEKQLRENYISKLFRYNEKHHYKKNNSTFKAKITGIDYFGHLFLEQENQKVEKFMFKEVEFVI